MDMITAPLTVPAATKRSPDGHDWTGGNNGANGDGGSEGNRGETGGRGAGGNGYAVRDGGDPNFDQTKGDSSGKEWR